MLGRIELCSLQFVLTAKDEAKHQRQLTNHLNHQRQKPVAAAVIHFLPRRPRFLNLLFRCTRKPNASRQRSVRLVGVQVGINKDEVRWRNPEQLRDIRRLSHSRHPQLEQSSRTRERGQVE